jgi:SAM-dependent methyltransferase
LIWRADPNRFLVEEVERIGPGRALDLACGEGRNSVWLASQGWRVVGVDYSSVGLAKARQLAADRSVDVTWIEDDVVTWMPPQGAFDLVLVLYLHLPAEQRRQVMAHASSALAPGGVLLVIGHDTTNLNEGWGGPQEAAVLFTPEEVVADLQDLRIERAERVKRTVATDAGDVDAIDALIRAVRPL